MLRKFLDEDMIQLNIDADNWQEAIRVSAEPLLRRKKIESSYIEAMINAVETLGPYIVIMPGIAFPHARPSASVIEAGVCISILDRPIRFGSVMNDPVKVLVTFAAKSDEEHLEVLGGIAKYLSVEEHIRLLESSHDKKEILESIYKYSGE